MSKTNWSKIVYVKEAPLMLDAYILKHLTSDRILDNTFLVPCQSYLYLDGDIYYSEKEVETYDRLILNNLNNLDTFFELIYKIGNRFANKESLFDAKDLKTKSNKELAEIFTNFLDKYQNALSTLYSPVAMDRVLSKFLRNYIRKQFPEKETELFNALTVLTKDHDTVKYHHELIKLALTSKQRRKKEFEKLADQYKFLGIKFYFGKQYDASTVRNHFDEILKHDFKAEEKQKQLLKRKELADFKKALRILKPSTKIRKYITSLQEAIFMRTYRLERICEGESNSLVLLKEISKKLGRFSEYDMVYLRSKEIIRGLLGKQKITRAKIEERQKPFGMISDGKQKGFYFGKTYNKFKQRHQTAAVPAKEVKGQIAYPGLVRGKVRIIRTDDEMHKIKKGEILVTRMTTPDYIFAMRTSAAVVTDVGGVTSHASVVSRELGKPCVIGTVNATQIFKTGDLVEVDANKGIVRKL